MDKVCISCDQPMGEPHLRWCATRIRTLPRRIGPEITVGRQETGRNASIVIVLRPVEGRMTARIAAARKFVKAMTGREPYQWTDGTGTVCIGESGDGWQT